MRRLGRITVDSTKKQANVSSESVLEQDEYEAMRSALMEILAEAEALDKREESQQKQTLRLAQGDNLMRG
jgi:hypothetical protein